MKRLLLFILALALPHSVQAASLHHESLNTRRQEQTSFIHFASASTVLAAGEHAQPLNQLDTYPAPVVFESKVECVQAQTSFSSLFILSRGWQRSVATRAPPRN